MTYASWTCQSPIYQDTHFYAGSTDKSAGGNWVRVNPLSIRTPISTDCWHGDIRLNGIIVSIPYLSGHPFLHSVNNMIKTFWTLCQSPIYQDTHFYLTCLKEVSICLKRVNPLSIRTPISTLTPKIAWIYAASQPRFCRYLSDNSDKGLVFGFLTLS